MKNIGNPALAQIVHKSREAQKAGSPSVCSTGEAVTAALVLNRPDWLAKMGYTLAEAIERVGEEWIHLIPAAAAQIREMDAQEAYADAERIRQEKLAELEKQKQGSEEIDMSAALVTYGNAPGYRDVSLIFDLVPIGPVKKQATRMRIHVSAEDGETIARHILEVHRFVWRDGERPIDAQPDESRPRWIDGR